MQDRRRKENATLDVMMKKKNSNNNRPHTFRFYASAHTAPHRIVRCKSSDSFGFTAYTRIA